METSSTAGKGRRRETEPPKVRLLHLWFPSRGEDDEGENPPSMESENSEEFPNTENKTDQRNEGMPGFRKKLRLSPQQSTLLEGSFLAHNTLTSLQKEDLAHKLGLRPRQVEVWFQNRRARIKLKQTEVDCEVLKGWCERLSEENRRLRKETEELRFNAKVSEFEGRRVCPSCGRVIAEEEKAGDGGDLGKEAREIFSCAARLCVNRTC